MATSLTYAGFAEVLPDLATDVAARRTIIEGFLNQAELEVQRSAFGETVPSNSTYSRADLAVYLLAGHMYTMYLRALGAHGQAAVGQVVSHNDDAKGVSYQALPTSSLADAVLATTPAGARYLQLKSSVGGLRLPYVAGWRR